MRRLTRSERRVYAGLAAMVIFFIAVAALQIAPDKGTEYAGATGPVVLELFTSQGCSSCPPADAFLQELAQDPAWEDRLIPLAFHVDYWNYLGWRDPFSRPAWTARQGDYVAAMGGATLYTPQLVIHGREEAVGVRYREIRSHIADLLRAPAAHALHLDVAELRREGDRLKGRIEVHGYLPAESGEVGLRAVIFENVRTTAVTQGENAGKTLKNDFIVRNMHTAARLQNASNRKKDIVDSLLLDVPVERAFDPSVHGVVLLAQETASMQMLGATVQRKIE